MHWLPYYEFLALPQLAFTVWMLVDCYRRRADAFWYWVIILIPFGAWAYFFVVKIRDFSVPGGWSLFHHRPALDELRYRAEQTPTLASHLELAQRLIERHEHADAIPHLEAALKMEPDHAQVIYSLAVCLKEQGHPEQAIPLLEKIVARDRAWSNYSAWHLLIAAQALNGDNQTALQTCRELVRFAPTLQHRCLLAERLLAAGMTEEARQVLEQSLDAHRYAPGPVRRLNRRWASEARRLQKQATSR